MTARARRLPPVAGLATGSLSLTVIGGIISAGMIAFAFIRNHTSGAPLALVLVMLVIFAADVPLIIVFTVARYSSSPYSR